MQHNRFGPQVKETWISLTQSLGYLGRADVVYPVGRRNYLIPCCRWYASRDSMVPPKHPWKPVTRSLCLAMVLVFLFVYRFCSWHVSPDKK